MHRVLQRGVHRVVYGRWHEPYDVLAGLGQQLAAAGDVDRLLEATVTELATGLATGLDTGLDLRDVSVRGVNDARIAGAERSGTVSMPLGAYGHTVGRLCYEPPGSR